MLLIKIVQGTGNFVLRSQTCHALRDFKVKATNALSQMEKLYKDLRMPSTVKTNSYQDLCLQTGEEAGPRISSPDYWWQRQISGEHAHPRLAVPMPQNSNFLQSHWTGILKPWSPWIENSMHRLAQMLAVFNEDWSWISFSFAPVLTNCLQLSFSFFLCKKKNWKPPPSIWGTWGDRRGDS